MDLFEREERCCMHAYNPLQKVMPLPDMVPTSLTLIWLYTKGHLSQYMIIHMDGPYLCTDPKACGGWMRLRYIPPLVKRSLHRPHALTKVAPRHRVYLSTLKNKLNQTKQVWYKSKFCSMLDCGLAWPLLR